MVHGLGQHKSLVYLAFLVGSVCRNLYAQVVGSGSVKVRLFGNLNMQKAYARLNVQYPSAYVERIKAAASSQGETLAGYVKRAIDDRMRRDEEKPSEIPDE
jgi:hypothetical protein